MSASSKKTVSILCAAGGLVAAAVALGSRNQGVKAPAPPSPISHTDPADPKEPILAADTCAAGPANASQDLGFGTLKAGMSSAKVLRTGPAAAYAAFEIGANEAAATVRPPLNIALVVDRSGSMDSDDKMTRAREAASALVKGMTDQDRLALVEYDDTADVLVPSIKTDAEGRKKLLAAIAKISTRGSTNLHGGMILGRDEIKRALGPGQVSRVILLSDGLANAGVTDPTRIADDARRAADTGVRLTTVGVGNDYNEDLMEAIAEAGRGHYYYVKDSATLETVIAGEWKSMQSTVATAVELRLEPACGGVEIEEVIGYESRREGGKTIVPMADVFGGDSRKIVVKLKLPSGATASVGTVRGELVFKDAKTSSEKTVAVRLGVEVTDDQLQVDGSADKNIMGYVLQVEAAKTMRQAAAAYEKGDIAGARGYIAGGRANAQAVAKKYDLKPEAAAPALHNFTEFDGEVQTNAPGSMGAKAALKQRKTNAREMSK